MEREITAEQAANAHPIELSTSVEKSHSVSANCIILNEAGEMLLLQRDVPGKRQLETPGGGQRKNESLKRTAVREAWEEIGGLEGIEIVARVITTRYKKHGERRRHVNFLARIKYTELSPKQKMHKSIGFYPFDQLEQMEKTELAANVRQLLKARREGGLKLGKRDAV